ncbi:TPA: tail fiber domain-containing protein [Stenotrophomonas maltophilia]|nr:tail fiber domain-containing protein [Stenotrophomonas maltophilia]
MARQAIDIDTVQPNGKRGDPARTMATKINGMTAELYNLTLGLTYAGGNYFSGGWIATGAGGSVGWDDRNEGAASRWYSFARDGTLLFYYAATGALPMTVTRTGAVTATSFNPTSSADVKDYIEGYGGDACDELDRMVVISYRYRPEFADIDKTFVGLLSENVRDVHPSATDGGGEVDVVDESGGTVRKHLPLNVDMMQILALNTRAHQQKSKRIRDLEAAMADALQRIAVLEGAA